MSRIVPSEGQYMVNETLFEKFIRVTMDSVQARALLREIVRVHGLPAAGAEAAAEREAALLRLRQLAQEDAARRRCSSKRGGADGLWV